MTSTDSCVLIIALFGFADRAGPCDPYDLRIRCVGALLTLSDRHLFTILWLSANKDIYGNFV